MPTSPASRVLQIDITGRDRSGVTHALASVLAESDARILDIGQAVIHDSLALGLLVEMTDSLKCSATLSELLLRAHEIGVEIRFRAATAGEYAGWVAAQGRARFLITMLGTELSARHLAAVSGLISSFGLNIDRIERLSNRVELDSPCDRASVELAVSGHAPAEDEIRGRLLELSSEIGFDLAIQRDDVYRRHRRLVAFDMDSTLIQAEIIDELAKAAGVGEQVAKVTEAAMRGELDFQASFRQRVGLLRGLPETALQAIVERVPLMDGAERLTRTLRKLGYKMAILSGGFTFFGQELQRRLGIDYLHANTLDVRDGLVTGEVIPPIIDGQRKAQLLREIAAAEGIPMEQVIAVGDGANDLPMLRLAGLGIAFRAKPVVRQGAKQSLSRLGLDGILYLLGVRDREALI
jgi:phosphoserine phosphatase